MRLANEPASTQGTEAGAGALASIRRLEQTLAEDSAGRAAAERLLEAARAEAASILAAAAQNIAEAAAERRRRALADADREAREIRRQAEAGAEHVTENAGAVMDAAVDAALALILATGDEGGS
jgi:vacuolar-type H+-ATPase subunit H